MPAMRNTVERLDRPSTYGNKSIKKRRYNRDEEAGDQDMEQPQTLEEKLKDATTLYVGNL